MGKWLERALASVPLVPLAPIGPEIEANGTIGTIGTTVADDIEREERLAVYGGPEGDAARERGEVGQEGRPKTVSVENGFSPVSAADIGLSRKDIHEARIARDAEVADRFESRPADWLPEPSPGIRILRPAIELSAAEYDKHLDVLIAALPAGSVEAQRLAFAKRKGWVVECEGRRIYTRGRF